MLGTMVENTKTVRITLAYESILHAFKSLILLIHELTVLNTWIMLYCCCILWILTTYWNI